MGSFYFGRIFIAPHYIDNVVNIRDGPAGEDVGGKLHFEAAAAVSEE